VANLKDSIQNFNGELYDDVSTLALYSTDASIYQKKPQLVAVPKNTEDLKNLITFANRNKIAVVPKGSATSLAGQAVNEGIAIDFTKYFNSIVEINPEQRYAIVQPGVTRDVLNKEIQKYNLHFAPDPATSSRATFGGMIANNSSGTKSILYGKSSEHVIELTIMTTSGEILVFNNKTLEDYQKIASSQNI
jgi:FAD/FMN-containing dehydrogenase